MLGDYIIVNGIKFRKASVKMGAKRGLLIAQAWAEPDEVTRSLKVNYANLQAAAVEGELPTFEQFEEMDETAANPMIDAVQQLNPHWYGLEPAQQEKKAES